MQNSNHPNLEDKFPMNFGNFDAEALFHSSHMGGLAVGMKRSAHDAGLDAREPLGMSPEGGDEPVKKEDVKLHHASSSARDMHLHPQTTLDDDPHHTSQKAVLPNGKKTKGRVKIKMEFIDNKLRRYTTFSKRKTGIMKKAYELSTLTGTQVMLLVASETGHVYTFATRKLQPMITSEAGKALIQTCLHSPDPPQSVSNSLQQNDQRMSATGYEETELTYAVTEEEHKSPSGISDEYFQNCSSYSGSDSSSPPTPSLSPAHTPPFSIPTSLGTPNSVISTGPRSGTGGINPASLPVHLAPGLVLRPSANDESCLEEVETNITVNPTTVSEPSTSSTQPQPPSSTTTIRTTTVLRPTTTNLTTLTIRKAPALSGGSVIVGNPCPSLMYSPGGNVVYAHNPSSLPEGAAPLLLNLPQGLQLSPDQGSSSNSQLVTLPMNFASAAAAAVVSAAVASNSNSSTDSLPTDLSLHIKRENRS